MTSKFFKSTVILSFACLAVAHGTYSWGTSQNCKPKSESCRNGNTAELECPEDEYIEVLSACYTGWWGRGWKRVWKYCCDQNTFQKVQPLCNSKTKCEFTCDDSIFNETNCIGQNVEKLKVKYKCKENPCSTFCCSNGGTCELTSDMTPMCVCNGTWSGTNCEDNPCNYTICENNGTCLVNPTDGTAQCVCTKDFTGTTCETEMPCNDTDILENPCDSFTCENNGSCLVNPVNNTAQCCCTSDYTGETCETQLDACSSVQCQNEGNCTIGLTGQAVCQCPTGFVGTFCQNDCSVTQTCPDGYDELPAGSGNCYLICDSEAESWLAAVAFCRLNGSVLWEPNDMDEVNAVTPKLDLNAEYWTGAFDGLSEGTTVFTGSGLPFTLTFEGTNTQTKDCLSYERITPVAQGFKFYYRDCTSTNRRCICERQDPCDTPVPVIPGIPASIPNIPPFFASP